jgi:hypothetical protein
VALFSVFTAQEGPTPQTIPLFGIPPEVLAEHDGIYAYPQEPGERMTQEQAEVFARGESLREEKIKGAMLVNVKLPGVPFEGLAWAFRWDVDGQPAIWPGDEPGDKFVYVYELTLVDAKTGAFLLGAAESTGVEP